MNHRIRKKISNRLGLRSYKLYKSYLRLSKIDSPHILMVDYASRIHGQQQLSQTQLSSLFKQFKELAKDAKLPTLPRDKFGEYMQMPNNTITAPGESNILVHQTHIPIRMSLQNSMGDETQINMRIIKSRQPQTKQ